MIGTVGESGDGVLCHVILDGDSLGFETENTSYSTTAYSIIGYSTIHSLIYLSTIRSSF